MRLPHNARDSNLSGLPLRIPSLVELGEGRSHGLTGGVASAARGKGAGAAGACTVCGAQSTLSARMAAAAGSGTPREEEGSSGEGAAPQPQAPTNGSGARLSRLPLARVKALVKADPDVTLAGQEAIFILARAAVRGEREGHQDGGGERREGRGLVTAGAQLWGGAGGGRGGSGRGVLKARK